MTEDELRIQVDRFIQDRIDSVPHLEALLLLWNSRPDTWSPESMAKGLFIDAKAAKSVLQDLVRQKLAETSGQQSDLFCYRAESGDDSLISSVARAYQRDLLRITRMIHSKPAAAVRAFAQAFRFKKESE